MKYPIQKERLQLMSPCVNVCAAAAISPAPEADALRQAIQSAVRCHAVLRCRVQLAPDGSACLTDECAARPVACEAFTGSVEALIARQDQLPFALDEGELARFCYQREGDRVTLVAAAHHLICDGASLMLLMRDILLRLNGQETVEEPVRLLTLDDLPKRPKLALPLRVMMGVTAARWKRGGRTFDFDDDRRMFASYSAARPTLLRLRTLPVARLISLAHERGITVNSLLVAAFASELPAGESVGVPVNERPEGWTGVGNYAVAVGVKPVYDSQKSLADNAVAVHRLIRQKLDTPKDRYFLADFMGMLPGTLTDSLYFRLADGYQSPIADSLCAMCGYVDAVRGVTVSNLKTVQMPSDPAWAYRYDSLAFIPPYVPNVRAVVGASTYGDTLTLTLRTALALEKEEAARFDRACRALETL